MDDLFEDDIKSEVKEEKNEPQTVGATTSKKDKSNNEGFEPLDLKNYEDDAPVLPQEDEYDLQKELEAKFDELFGPLDED